MRKTYFKSSIIFQNQVKIRKQTLVFLETHASLQFTKQLVHLNIQKERWVELLLDFKRLVSNQTLSFTFKLVLFIQFVVIAHYLPFDQMPETNCHSLRLNVHVLNAKLVPLLSRCYIPNEINKQINTNTSILYETLHYK